MRRSHTPEPALITTAHAPADNEYDRRRKKYAVMMSLRALAVLGAALTYQVSVLLALGFIAAGVVLPWCAVLIANDGPAKKRAPAPDYRHDLRAERALPAGDDSRTVDG